MEASKVQFTYLYMQYLNQMNTGGILTFVSLVIALVYLSRLMKADLISISTSLHNFLVYNNPPPPPQLLLLFVFICFCFCFQNLRVLLDTKCQIYPHEVLSVSSNRAGCHHADCPNCMAIIPVAILKCQIVQSVVPYT